MPLWRALSALLEWGIKAEDSLQTRKRMIVTNGCVLIIIGISILYSATYAILQVQLMLYFSLLFIPGYISVLLLHRAGWTLVGRWWFSLLGVTHISSASVLLGQQAQAEWFLVVVCSLPFAMFSPEEKKHIITSLLLYLGVFLLTQWLYVAIGPVLKWESWFSTTLRYVTIIAIIAWVCISNYYNFIHIHRVEGLLITERDRSEQLLLNILPAPIAARLKQGEENIADGFSNVSVLFSDLVGFTVLSNQTPPAEIVEMLNEIISGFDDLSQKYGVEKIKTIGDAYMVAAGLPEPRDDHAEVIASMAIEMLEVVKKFNAHHSQTLQIRVGIHCGSVVAGVIGHRKFAYDLWGDTVNTAARMESHGIPGKIHVTEAFAQELQGKFQLEKRGPIDIKGKGTMETYLLG